MPTNNSPDTLKKEDWYLLSSNEVLQRLNTDASTGLDSTEAGRRLTEYGPNELEESGGHTWWQILIEQFLNLLTVILIIAAIISFFLGDVVEAVVVLLIVVLNGILGFVQEYRAEQSIAALKRMSVPSVNVRRDRGIHQISARDLVPGDVVILETGNLTPADGRVLKSINLRAQESALTGEAEAVEKEADLVFQTQKTIGDRRNMVYSGTIINYGRGEFVVTETGMRTELGHIAEMLQAVKEEKTPLQERLDRLGKYLAVAAIALVAIVFLTGVWRGEPVEDMLLTSVSLAVAAIPEALTAVVTIALSLGAQRMLKRNALIRKLPAVETLGSVSVICSDKTGTLTQNRMTVTVLDIANQRIMLDQLDEAGRFGLRRNDQLEAGCGTLPTLDLLLVSGALVNDASLVTDDHALKDSTQDILHYHASGDPTEGALVVAAAECGILKDELDNALPRVAELPFDSERKRMTTLHRMPQSVEELPPSLQPLWEGILGDRTPPAYASFTKGAVDGLVSFTTQVWVDGELQPFDQTWRKRVMDAHDEMAQNGMRVLGVGLHLVDESPPTKDLSTLEQDLILVGMIGMMDPPRPEVTEAVAKCKQAGIRPVMITGDHPLTARHIARQVGILTNEQYITGNKLEELSDDDLRKIASQVSVFARVSPEHKIRLVQAFQELGNQVAMTGDGVNDAPALKKADIGVAMGITGTDVSKEAANMVLLDDNFATIVAAVEEGRVIFDNIRKFITYLLSCNTSEIAVMLIGPFLGLPIPLLPLQILWMNLVTDGLPALALGVEAAEQDVMKRPPISSQAGIFTRSTSSFIIGMGILMSLVSIGIGWWAYTSGDPAWQSLLFTTLIFSQIVLALEVRSETDPIWKIGLFSNRAMVWAVLSTVLLQIAVIYVPFFQKIFKTQSLGIRDVVISLVVSLSIAIFAEIWKWLRRKANTQK
jgi:Ca2+-transporting ATPase